MFLIGVLCCFAFAVLFVIVAGAQISSGAGLHLFPLPLSSLSVLLGLIHLFGLLAGASVSFVIGVGLLAHGSVPCV